ncbi:ABC transporter permease [Novosphingobium colocasiae]|uniref:ABC transporter permease n=1 Tax=Novosphingobium colocasiae TaxID=1256513 RepID=UPI0035B37404
MSAQSESGRLSILSAAWVIARRDFRAILFSRSFFLFLLGPLFPILVGGLAGNVGQRVQQSADHPQVGLVMTAADAKAMIAAREAMLPSIGGALPEFIEVHDLKPGEHFDPRTALAERAGNVAAILSGEPAALTLTGLPEQTQAWQGPLSLVAGKALTGAPTDLPPVSLVSAASSTASERKGRLLTAQGAQTLLFLLTMLLAGMVLSNLVEEKANKIIEILAAAIPMDAVFLGKLFAMLGISFVGIATWGAAGGLLALGAGSALPALTAPAVGWPVMLVLGLVYFSMAYLLLGSVFLTIGSMAATVRDVQTLSMPATMMQLLVFFFASYAMTQPGSAIELAAVIFPFSSPFAMMARAALDDALLPHVVAIIGQALVVLVLVRFGSRLFRRRVMQSGPAGGGRKRRGLFRRGSAKAA